MTWNWSWEYEKDLGQLSTPSDSLFNYGIETYIGKWNSKVWDLCNEHESENKLLWQQVSHRKIQHNNEVT